MIDKDREVLATVSRLNRDMGAIVVALLASQTDGHLSSERLRELAGICDEMSRLLDGHADSLDQLLVIDGESAE